jgi:hypothetical protein
MKTGGDTVVLLKPPISLIVIAPRGPCPGHAIPAATTLCGPSLTAWQGPEPVAAKLFMRGKGCEKQGQSGPA